MKLKILKAKVCDIMRYNWNWCRFRIGSLMCTWLFQCVCFKRVNFVPELISVWPRERNISVSIDTSVSFLDYDYLYIFIHICIFVFIYVSMNLLILMLFNIKFLIYIFYKPKYSPSTLTQYICVNNMFFTQILPA